MPDSSTRRRWSRGSMVTIPSGGPPSGPPEPNSGGAVLCPGRFPSASHIRAPLEKGTRAPLVDCKTGRWTVSFVRDAWVLICLETCALTASFLTSVYVCIRVRRAISFLFFLFFFLRNVEQGQGFAKNKDEQKIKEVLRSIPLCGHRLIPPSTVHATKPRRGWIFTPCRGMEFINYWIL